MRNSRTDSSENAGLILIPGTSYTIAVYGEDESGNYNVSTKEFVVPVAEINGSVELSINMGTITETSAEATLTASEQCKVIFGYVDPAITAADTENPFDFEGKSDEVVFNSSKIDFAFGPEEETVIQIPVSRGTATEPFTTNIQLLDANGETFLT